MFISKWNTTNMGSAGREQFLADNNDIILFL